MNRHHIIMNRHQLVYRVFSKLKDKQESVFWFVSTIFLVFIGVKISYPEVPYLGFALFACIGFAQALWGFVSKKPQHHLFPPFRGEKRKLSIGCAIVSVTALGLVMVMSVIVPLPKGETFQAFGGRFLSALSKDSFHNAHALLAPEAQKQISETQLKNQWISVEKRYGKPLSWKFIREESSTRNYVEWVVPIIYQVQGKKGSVKVALYITQGQKIGPCIVKYEIPSQYKDSLF